jgi:alkyl hydroperoxide reductase subunit AhpF
MDRLFSEDLIVQIRQAFEKLDEPVQLILFVEENKQDVCGPTRQLLEELVPLSEKLTLIVYDLRAEPELAQLYKVQDKAPAIVLAAKNGENVTDFGIRYLGVPSGYEFSTLIQDILLVSGRESGLSLQLKNYIKALKNPLHLEVFVTPT